MLNISLHLEKFIIGPSLKEISGIGSWYYKTIKSYAGLGTLISYFRFIFNMLETFDLGKSIFESGAFAAMIILPLVPFLVMFFFIPTMIVFESRVEKKRQKLIHLAKNLGVNKDLMGIVR